MAFVPAELTGAYVTSQQLNLFFQLNDGNRFKDVIPLTGDCVKCQLDTITGSIRIMLSKPQQPFTPEEKERYRIKHKEWPSDR